MILALFFRKILVLLYDHQTALSLQDIACSKKDYPIVTNIGYSNSVFCSILFISSAFWLFFFIDMGTLEYTFTI